VVRNIQKAVFVLALAGAAPVPAQQRAQEPAAPANTLRADVTVVSVYFSVRDHKGRLIPDLDQRNFHVLEDGREHPIRFFARHTDVPLNIGVLLDTSTAMTPLLETEANAASSFLRRVMHKDDLGFAVSYNAHVEVLQLPTDRVDTLDTKVHSIRRYGKYDTAPQPPPAITTPRLPMPMPLPVPEADRDLRVAKLYDAVSMSVDRFLAQELGRKAMLILALADDAHSDTSIEGALRALKKSETIAYVVEVEHARRERDDCDIRHIFRSSPDLRIARLAEETGGRVISVKGFDKLQGAFEEIATELHNQYSLGYTPINTSWDGLFRRIEIRSNTKSYRVYARNGYYATPRKNSKIG
jgi:VWFA-related protein